MIGQVMWARGNKVGAGGRAFGFVSIGRGSVCGARGLGWWGFAVGLRDARA